MGKERLDRQLSQALSTKTPRSHTSNAKQQIDKHSSRTSSKATSKTGWSKLLKTFLANPGFESAVEE